MFAAAICMLVPRYCNAVTVVRSQRFTEPVKLILPLLTFSNVNPTTFVKSSMPVVQFVVEPPRVGLNICGVMFITATNGAGPL